MPYVEKYVAMRVYDAIFIHIYIRIGDYSDETIIDPLFLRRFPHHREVVLDWVFRTIEKFSEHAERKVK